MAMKTAVQAVSEKVGALHNTEDGKVLFGASSDSLLFVYGTLKFKGVGHKMFLSSALFMGECRIGGILLYDKAYPRLIPHPVCKVVGEVWKVTWKMLMQCDGYEGVNRGLFARRQVVTPYGRAWAYFIKDVPELGPNTLCCKEGIWKNDGTTEPQTLLQLSQHEERFQRKMRALVIEGENPNETGENPKKVITLPTLGDVVKSIREKKPSTALVKVEESKIEDAQVGPGTEMY